MRISELFFPYKKEPDGARGDDSLVFRTLRSAFYFFIHSFKRLAGIVDILVFRKFFPENQNIETMVKSNEELPGKKRQEVFLQQRGTPADSSIPCRQGPSAACGHDHEYVAIGYEERTRINPGNPVGRRATENDAMGTKRGSRDHHSFNRRPGHPITNQGRKKRIEQIGVKWSAPGRSPAYERAVS